jgi:HSP20 family molecular chaperone IbpA
VYKEATMIFTANPAALQRRTYGHPSRSLERFLDGALNGTQHPSASYSQDDAAFTLELDMPGVSREQLSISIEDKVVRIASKEGASRSYRTAYEFPQVLDAAASEAKLENGVLTLKLAKKVPVKNITELNIQ